LAWTVTAEPEGVLVHCTINRTEHDPDFIESIETFVEDWRAGLERCFRFRVPDKHALRSEGLHRRNPQGIAVDRATVRATHCRPQRHGAVLERGGPAAVSTMLSAVRGDRNWSSPSAPEACG
jgi:hypothetical protein